MKLEEISKIVKETIRDIKDFPKEGIVFKDITTLLNDGDTFRKLIDYLKERYKDKKIDYIVGIDARGFIFGSALAYALKCGFVPIRKKGKLPHKTISKTYDLEYGSDEVHIHKDAFLNKKDANVILIDDLLATGGTARASCELLKEINANIIEACFILNLTFLGSDEERLKDINTFSVLNI
jgi:adenine phosphoribosyltransferase